jgi:hypothetical protein
MHILLFAFLVSLTSLSGCYIGQKLFGMLYKKCDLNSTNQIQENL